MTGALALLVSLFMMSSLVHDVTGQCSSITTFNAGLTNAVAAVDSRLPLIKNAIKENNADVMCLQEVWYERLVQDMTNDLEDLYPYHYSAIHKGVSQLRDSSKSSSLFSWFTPDTPCSSSEISYIISDVVGCALSEGCIGGSAQQVGACLARKCRSQLKSDSISQSCLSCTMFSLSSLTDTVKECARVVGANNRFNGPGLLLLSKKPIKSVTYRNYHRFSKVWVERGVIDANIEGVGQVLCTHLSAKFNEYWEFDTLYRSYEQQQLAEIRSLGRYWFRNQLILLGDLNTGPEMRFTFDDSRSIDGGYPRNYRTLLRYGYRDPYAEQVRRCTYCKANSFVKGDENYMLDHVLIKGIGYRGLVAERVMTDYRGRTLSDHYGVTLRFCALTGK